jgi:hypothetical protein
MLGSEWTGSKKPGALKINYNVFIILIFTSEPNGLQTIFIQRRPGLVIEQESINSKQYTAQSWLVLSGN